MHDATDPGSSSSDRTFFSQKFISSTTTTKMDVTSLCGWCLPGLPETAVDTSAMKPKSVDVKAKAREAMVAKLGGKGPSSDKMGDNLDDLIKNRTADDLSVDELIQNNKASMEQLDAVISDVRSLWQKTERLITNCEKYRWESEGGFTYQRIEINNVKVESTEQGPNYSLISLKTTPTRKTKDFGLPAGLPSTVTDIIVVSLGLGGLPDYGKFIERSLILCNDVLKPFLQSLRHHLECIHAFYKEVSSWITEPDADRMFIEKTFGIDFDLCIPGNTEDANDDETQSCTTAEHSEAPMDDSGDDEGGVGASILKKKIDMSAYSNVRRAVVDEVILLKEYPSEGTYSLSFDIEYGQKEKLVKFIEFLQN